MGSRERSKQEVGNQLANKSNTPLKTYLCCTFYPRIFNRSQWLCMLSCFPKTNSCGPGCAMSFALWQLGQGSTTPATGGLWRWLAQFSSESWDPVKSKHLLCSYVPEQLPGVQEPSEGLWLQYHINVTVYVWNSWGNTSTIVIKYCVSATDF